MINKKTKLIINDTKKVLTSIKAVVSTKYSDKTYQVESMDIVSDFNSGYTDSLSLVLNIPLGDIKFELHPFREDLNITLYFTIKGKVYKKPFLAIIDKMPPTLEKEEITHLSKKELNKQMSGIQFQLLDFSILALRGSSSNGMFKDSTVEQVLGYVFNKDSVDISSIIDSPSLNLCLSKPHNTKTYQHIDLGKEKRITKIPEFLQETYGVYRTGLNLYKTTLEGLREHKDNLYIYPPLEANGKDNKLIIHVMSQPLLSEVEESYVLKDDVHHCIVTSSIPVDDDNSKHYTSGVNKSVHSPDLVMFNKPKVTTPKNGIQNEPKESIDRSEGLTPIQRTLTPFGDVEHTSNQFKLSSKMLKDNISLLQVKWSNSLADIIKPCMGCIVSFDNKEREGHVIASHTVITMAKSTTVLTIAIRKTSKLYDGSDNKTISTRVL